MSNEKSKDGFWSHMKKHLRRRLLAGAAVVVPVAITYWILVWLFEKLSGFLSEPLRWLINIIRGRQYDAAFGNDYVYAVLSVVAVLLLVMILYIVGWLTKAFIGSKLIGMGEAFLLKVPLVKSVYSACKQVMQAVSLPERAAFKSVVLLHFPHPRMWAIGFLTGVAQDVSIGKTLFRVFIPTTPNPTTGFFELAEASELLQTDISVEDAFKMIISGGIIWPANGYNSRPMTDADGLALTNESDKSQDHS